MVSGWWKDTGKPEDLLEANRMMLSGLANDLQGEVDDASTLQGPVVLGAGAKVIRSSITGPVVIGPDSVIEDSRVGPEVSIERECRVTRSSLEDSIVMEGCVIADVLGLTGSILGKNVEVRHSGAVGARRLVVGDQSKVEVD